MSFALEIASLIRLIELGCIIQTIRNETIINRYENAHWVLPGSRKNEWVTRPDVLPALQKRIAHLSPNWQEDKDYLRSISRNPYEPNDWEALPALKRQVKLQGFINRRNWNATTGLGPKHKARLPADATLTKDWLLRFRPNPGLCAMLNGKTVDLYELKKNYTECALPERAWVRLDEFTGTLPGLIVTCENLGAYIDFPEHDQTLIAFAPGADVEPVCRLLMAMPQIPWVHFGDLDQEGIIIAKAIAKVTERPLQFFIPSFVEDYLLDSRPRITAWSNTHDIPILNELKRMNTRLFQETFMLDARLHADWSLFYEQVSLASNTT